jgi:hypothetical protein
MSLTRSPGPLVDADVTAACTGALVDVAENSFFAFVVPTDADQFAAGVERPAEGGEHAWLTARIEFAGPFSGAIEIDLPVVLAESLRASFLGLEPDADAGVPPLSDSVGEFVNQVAGMWLTTTCHDQRFDLRPPAVVERPPGWRPPASGDGQVVTYEVNDLPLRLVVGLVTEG